MSYAKGSIVDDMRVIGYTMKKVGKNDVEHMICICEVCGREKLFQRSTLDRMVGTTHRMCNHDFTSQVIKDYPEFYRCWNHIKSRINNPNIEHYDRYGGRGLTNDYEYFVDFCDDLFESYLEHINKFGVENTTVERKDNDLGYVKGNIRWATWKEQAVNRCTTVIWEITDVLSGKVYRTDNLKDFCNRYDLNHRAFWTAYKRGQSLYKKRWQIRKEK